MDFLIRLFVHVLEAMFVVGATGSLLVMVLAAISESKSAVAPDEQD